MKRVLIEIAYDGTRFCGWQIQPEHATIEETLNKKLSKLLKEEIVIIGASRTDSGVHAIANVAVFDTENSIPAERVACALNSILPETIAIQRSYEVPLDFHPRYCKCAKTYQYRIYNNRHPMPTKRMYSYFVQEPLDTKRMKEACKYFIGEHDFKSFCSNKAYSKTTVRTIYDLSIDSEGSDIVITITGSGFLYNMVRIIAGTLVRVGKHTYSPEDITGIIECRDRTRAGHKAPACGLTLFKIDFPDLNQKIGE